VKITIQIFSNFKLKIPKIVKSPSRCDSATDHWLETVSNKIKQGIILSSYRLWETLISWVMLGWNVCLTIHLSQEKGAKLAWIKTQKDGNFREHRVKNIRNSGV